MHLILAPLHGFTEQTFRNVYFNHFSGFNEAFAPFISLTHGDKVTHLKVRDLLPDKNKTIPTIPQILGNEANDFIMLCRFLFDEYGYDQVDWNLGCPIRSIVSKKRGSGLLPYPSIIDTLLEKIIPGIPQQLSVKVRMGLNSTSEFPPLIEVLNRHPLSRVIVHARLGIQQYEGEILLEEFAGFLPLISHEVVFNGDIHNFDDFTSISTRLPNVRNFMIGRGILYNPFLTEMIRGSCKQLPEGWHTRFREYYYELENAMKINRKFWMSKMKEYWKYYSTFLKMDELSVQKLMQCNSEDEWHTIIRNYLN